MSRPRTFDEDQVLEGAVDLFHERGFAGVSVPDIVDRLGICRQSLYAAFGDKRGLYLKALARWGEREVDAKVALLCAAMQRWGKGRIERMDDRILAEVAPDETLELVEIQTGFPGVVSGIRVEEPTLDVVYETLVGAA